MRNKLPTWIVIIYFIAIIFVALLLHTADSHGTETLTYTVKKGDTLYLIGKEYGRNWKELADINNLEIVYKDKILYVKIDVGQVLMLDWPKKELSSEEIGEYVNGTKLWMEDEIFKIASIRDPEPRWAYTEVFEVPIRTFTVTDIRNTINKLNHLKRSLEVQCRYRMVDEIHSEALRNIYRFRYFGDKKFWEIHRKICIMLMAILDRESDGYFATGPYGEKGPWQVRPSTYCTYRSWKVNKENIEKAKKILMASSYEGLLCAMDRLDNKDKLIPALAHYNGYGHKANKYAVKVYRSYRRMMRDVDG